MRFEVKIEEKKCIAIFASDGNFSENDTWYSTMPWQDIYTPEDIVYILNPILNSLFKHIKESKDLKEKRYSNK